MTKCVCENPRAESIMMFDIADGADKCLGRTCWFPITGGGKLDM